MVDEVGYLLEGLRIVDHPQHDWLSRLVRSKILTKGTATYSSER